MSGSHREGLFEMRIERAREKLLSRKNEGHVAVGDDVVVMRKITPERANFFLEEELSVVVRYSNNTIFAVDLTKVGHACVSQRVLCLLFHHVYHILETGGGEDVPVIQGQSTRRPDGTAIPIHRPLNLVQPTIVVEVADSQSLDSLYGSATEYLDADIEGVVAIKMWDCNVQGMRPLLFMFFNRNANVRVNGLVIPTHIISFGTADLHTSVITHLTDLGVAQGNIRGKFSGSQDVDCAGPNQAPYLFFLPAAIVFHNSTLGIPVIPGNPLGNGFTLDLFDIQQCALRNM